MFILNALGNWEPVECSKERIGMIRLFLTENDADSVVLNMLENVDGKVRKASEKKVNSTHYKTRQGR